jgi:hypothetical protein
MFQFHNTRCDIGKRAARADEMMRALVRLCMCIGLPWCEADVPLAAAYLFLGQGHSGATRGTLTLSLRSSHFYERKSESREMRSQ